MSEQPQADHAPKAGRRAYATIWLLGVAVLLGSLGFFVAFARVAGDPYDRFWQLIAVHLVGGRPGNAGLGLELGFSPWYILYQSCVQDAIVMLFAYPFLLMGYEHASRLPVVGPRVEKVHTAAQARKHKVAPYGMAGVFAFVMFPLWGTGPLVGMLVGQLIGLGIVATYLASLAGVVVSTAAWIWGYHWLQTYNDTLALYLLIGFFVCGAIMAVAFRVYKRHVGQAVEAEE